VNNFSRRYASFIPNNPTRLLVLAHGYPWPDGSRTDDELAAYAEQAVDRWRSFADQQHVILVAPAFGGSEFAGYREMTGREIGPDEFINTLADELGAKYLRHFSGVFSLHGHSAGAQFAARYLVAHPGRLENVILSAPSTYPLPDPAVPWPNGMGAASAAPANWLTAATYVTVDVLVGTQDTEPRPAAPGQQGSTRIERAIFWARSMRGLAEAAGARSRTRLVWADGLGHDEPALAGPAQEILARNWTAS
jgi:pimeloyl-ACP methyl ester carboxylesterase